MTGIASPEQMVYDLQNIIPQLELMSFPDHHHFTKRDIENIRHRAAGRTILTTEKDATRIQGLDNLKIIPIEVEFLDNKKKEFDHLIKNYVKKTLHKDYERKTNRK